MIINISFNIMIAILNTICHRMWNNRSGLLRMHALLLRTIVIQLFVVLIDLSTQGYIRVLLIYLLVYVQNVQYNPMINVLQSR